MEKDILSRVIEVEKEIQRCLEIEKANVKQWLDEVKKESEEEFLREEKIIRESLDTALAHAAHDAEAGAAEIVKAARSSADRMNRLSAEVLTGFVQQEIRKILPE